MRALHQKTGKPDGNNHLRFSEYVVKDVPKHTETQTRDVVENEAMDRDFKKNVADLLNI